MVNLKVNRAERARASAPADETESVPLVNLTPRSSSSKSTQTNQNIIDSLSSRIRGISVWYKIGVIVGVLVVLVLSWVVIPKLVDLFPVIPESLDPPS